ncbi:MAG: Gfo/Idh/MocA family oxidoreductase, partial [Candidatus Omnitrophota bacterium]
MAKNGEIGIAVIGCGRIAQDGHLPYFKAHKEARLVAAVDVNEDNRRKVCKKFGIAEAFESAEEMFAKVKPDAALICTPSWVHRDLTLLAAANGAHVFCEKPMAANAAQCREMIDACAGAGVVFQLGMVKRFDAGIVKAKKMMLDGRLGNVSQIAAYSLNPPAPMDTPLMETVKKWMETLGVDFDARTGWWRFTDPRATGGQLME